ncbi:MAG: tRNA (guanosine(46)-N7)-methyltransferase TrmB [Halioglobus sp.]|nr:tRNA (guanosine(46)-N7)-methyltransferase TrmB [Halioglobus sp.]
MTDGQKRAYERGWRHWGLEHRDGLLDAQQVFGRRAPLTLEIGFGMGQSLLEMALQDPARDFVGVEVHRPGVGRLLHGIERSGATNIRVYCHDAVDILRDCIADGSLDCVQVFFPDPWHKKRHHKRRLVQPEFVAALARALRPGGVLHLATDWQNYAEHMMEVVSACPDFSNAAGAGAYAPRPSHRPLTKFEQRGERLGHGVWDLVFTRR